MNKGKMDKKRLLAFLIALGVFLYAGTRLGMICFEYYRGQKEYDRLAEIGLIAEIDLPDKKEIEIKRTEKEKKQTFSVDFEALKSINPQIVGWIWFENLDISYPIAQGEDNEYYLTHSFYKEELKSGSIFMEAQNKPDLSDDNTFIYGHNMKDKSMFAKLNQFQKKDVFEENPEFFIYREDGIYRYQIFSCYVANVGWDSFLYQFEDKEQYMKWLKTVKGRSNYDMGFEPYAEQKTVSLMTCTSGDEYRFIVHGALVEKIENK